MEYLLASIVGVGLAAACGLRAFVPVLGMALASKAGWIHLGPSFDWLASWPAIVGLSLACLLEVTGSLLPAVNHALDAVAAPVAFAAGTLVMGTQLGSVAGWTSTWTGVDLPGVETAIQSAHPMLTWGAALIAGGGVATAVHAGSATARAGSTAVSAGLLSPVYGLIESVTSVVASVLAFVVPVLFALTFIVVALVGVFTLRWWIIRRRRQARAGDLAPSLAPNLAPNLAPISVHSRSSVRPLLATVGYHSDRVHVVTSEGREVHGELA